MGFTVTRTSLTGLIQQQWFDDARPALDWKELLGRTIQADEQLEKIGVNAARVFRQHRHEGNIAAMQRYITGFYEYEFSPNYNPRKRSREIKIDPPQTPEPPPRPPTGETEHRQRSDADLVIALSKSVETILEQIEPRGPNRGVASWINELERKNRIPKPVSFRMHGIRINRNKVIHESYMLTPAERRALEADWATIDEWWKSSKNR